MHGSRGASRRSAGSRSTTQRLPTLAPGPPGRIRPDPGRRYGSGCLPRERSGQHSRVARAPEALEAFAAARERVGDGAWPTDHPLKQRAMCRLIQEHRAKALLTSPEAMESPLRHAQMRSTRDGKTLWATGIPSKTLGWCLTNTQFSAAAKWWLGVAQTPADGPCSLCGHPADRFGAHASHCKSGPDTIARHNAVRDRLFAACQQAGFGALREVALFADSAERAADVFLSSGNVAIDCAIISPLIESRLKQESQHSIAEYAKAKRCLYEPRCSALAIEFVPFVLTTSGAMSDSSADLLRHIARGVASRGTETYPESLGFIRQQLQFEVIRAVATGIVTRLPAPNHAPWSPWRLPSAETRLPWSGKDAQRQTGTTAPRRYSPK